MSLTLEQNELLTRVENGAPMGRYLRETTWFPAVLSSCLEPGGAPYPVRLLGEDYVAFRGANGAVGVFSEYCPHRGASLLLARNEDNALRCIYHGWKFSSEGRTVEVPTQATDHDSFCAKVPLVHRPVREAAGMVWVWLGERPAPPLPDLGYMALCGHHVQASRSLVPYNWVQSLEGLVDTAHVSVLHKDQLAKYPELATAGNDEAPLYEFEDRPHGFRYAGIRKAPGGNRYVRITEVLLPIFNYAPGGTQFINVPIDDTHTAYWSVRYNPREPLKPSIFTPEPGADRMNWPPPLPPRAQRWGQNREAMKNGATFSGFAERHLFHEDMAIASSQGQIAQRNSEFLNVGDQAVIRLRSLLLREVRAFAAGESVAPVSTPTGRFGGASLVIDQGVDWRIWEDPAASVSPA